MNQETQASWTLSILNSSMQAIVIFISILALFIAGGSLWVASQARSDVRDIEHLDLEPRISFSATLLVKRYLEDIVNLYGPSSFTIANFGPVDAVQVKVEFIDICFDRDKKKVGSYGSNLETVVGTVAPYERKKFELPQSKVNLLATCHDRPPSDAAVLAWISYKRESDRKTYITRALYFVSKSGHLSSDSMYYYDKDGNSLLSDDYYDVYSDMIIDWADALGEKLEQDEWHAIYPLDIEARSKTIYHSRL